MDLIEALRCFTRIVEVGSFSAVARENTISASAVNRQIAQLEPHFGIWLFHRMTRRLSLTDDGRELLSHARHLSEMADEIMMSMSHQEKSPTGLMRVATPIGTARLLMPRLRNFLERHPGLSVELLVSDRVENLIEARLDLAIRAGTVDDTSLVVRSIGTVASIAVAAPAYLERHGAPSTPADLARHACMVHDLGPESTIWALDGPGGPAQVRVSGALIANSTEVVRQAALEGYGIALLPEPMWRTISGRRGCIACCRSIRPPDARCSSSIPHAAIWRPARVQCSTS